MGPPELPAESEAARRGKLNSTQLGEYHFTDTHDAIGFVAGEVRRSKSKYKEIAKGADIKSTATISRLASGRTLYPRFSTIFGTASALGLELVLTRTPRKDRQA